MSNMNISLLLVVFVITCILNWNNATAQPTTAATQAASPPLPRIAQAIYTDKPPKIDGSLSDSAWQHAPPMTEFIQYTPVPYGKPSQHTEVRVLYGREAIYIGAKMFDTAPDSILQQLCVRDDIWNANVDNFGIYIDGMSTKQNMFIFIVTASGVQYDSDTWDEVWDAVWRSRVQMVNDGWVAEIEIPYSQLRFPPNEKQTWGINFSRTIRRLREESYWAAIDPSNDNEAQQYGILHGIERVKPPVRLSFTPYVAGYARHYDDHDPATNNWKPTASAGADLKYGINESFTLDVALIPDFGDIQSDNLEFNLSPFEIYYEERRPFFTEGINLFSRGDLFYSRRIGSTPSRYDWVAGQLHAGETIANNPSVTRLINATKLSGRTKKRLGIGVFNAVTAPAYAQIRDSSQATRRVLTEPLTNYNVLVLDQQFGTNSYVSFIQTSVARFGAFADAFTWGTEFRLVNKKNLYGITGAGAYNQLWLDTAVSNTRLQNGYRYNIALQKLRGNFRFRLAQNTVSAKFDINDLGYITATNFINTRFDGSYTIFKPFGIYNYFKVSTYGYHEMLYNPNKFSRVELGGSISSTFRNFLSAGCDVAYQPFGYRDYYEARNDFQVWDKPRWGRVGAWFSSDYRKAFALDGSFSYRSFIGGDSTWRGADIWEFAISPRIRLSDKLNLVLKNNVVFRRNNLGFAAFDVDGAVVFGSRYRQDMTNTIEANYLFNNVMALSLRVRHYWSIVEYDHYYGLSDEGRHVATSYNSSRDSRYNAFNMDLIYRWRFAPGSELNIVWKNAVLDYDAVVIADYWDNVQTMFATNQRNSFSIKCLYFLDYFKLQRHLRT